MSRYRCGIRWPRGSRWLSRAHRTGVLANSSRAAGAQVLVAPGLLPNADPDVMSDSVGLICEAVGDQRPSLIHSHLIQAGFVGRAVARKLGTPQVYTQHMYNSLDPFVRTVAGRGDAPDIIAVSRNGYTEISEIAGGAGRVHLVPNGVDRPGDSGFRLRLGQQQNLLYCGRLSPEKGVDVPLLAFARVLARHLEPYSTWWAPGRMRASSQ